MVNHLERVYTVMNEGDFGVGGEIAYWTGFSGSNDFPGIHAEVPMDLDLNLCKTWYS